MMKADAMDNVEPRDVSVRFIHDQIFLPCSPTRRLTARDAGWTGAAARRIARRKPMTIGFPPRKIFPTLPASSRSRGRCRFSNRILASNAASSAGVEGDLPPPENAPAPAIGAVAAVSCAVGIGLGVGDQR